METKEAYKEKIEAQLREWGAKIEELRSKADQAKADAKIEYMKQVEELRKKRELAQGKLEELRSASDEAWDAIKVGVEKASADLKSAIDSAISKFK